MRTFFTLVFLCHGILSFAQKTSLDYLPSKTKETPSWFLFFYNQPTQLSKINVIELDKKVKEYEKEFEKQQKRIAGSTPSVNSTGEENEDVYILYYKRWRREIDEYVQENGFLKLPTEQQLLKTHNDAVKIKPIAQRPSSATANWNLVGPVETFLRMEDDVSQPPVPWQSNVYAIAVAPSNPSILYSCTEPGGIFKTTDKGLHWNMVTMDYAISTCYAISVHPTNPDYAIAGNSSGFYYTTDGGASWSSFAISTGSVNTIVFNTANPSEVFAATNNGLFRSIDGGISWVNYISGRFRDVAYKANDNNIMFALNTLASGYTEFWRSTDGGITFAPSISGWTKDYTTDGGGRFTVTPADPNRIYAIILSSSTGLTKPYIFKSTDAGLTWDTTATGINSGLLGGSTMPSNGQGFYDLDILANPNNADELIIATTTAYKSVNGGINFTSVGGYHGAFGIHPDIQEMIAFGNDTWITTDGGVNYSSDFFTAKANFSPRTRGIFSSAMWGYTQGWNEDIVAGGRYHNGNTAISENYPAGEALRLGGGEAATGYYFIGKPRHIAFSDISPVVIPELKNGYSSRFTFTKYPDESGYGSDISDMLFSPYCYNTIFVGADTCLYKSTNGGLSWEVVYNFQKQYVKHFAIARSNPDVIYLATNQNGIRRLKKSINGGISWADLTLPAGSSGNKLSITVSAADENILWIVSPNNSSNNRVFKSVNGGLSWINLTTETINTQGYKNIVHQYGSDGGVYISGDNGQVYYRNNSMPDWAAFNTGLPAVSNNTYLKLFYRDSKVRSASGQGIWQSDFYEEAPPVAQPTVDKLTSTCTRDTFYFDDYSALNHASATWSWSFPGASYVSSTTARNPKVVYSSMGTYDFTLTVSNPYGSSTKTVLQKIQITSNECNVDTIPGNMLTLSNPGDFAQQTSAINITTNTITLSCWIKPNGNQSSFAGIIFSGSDNGTGLDFRNNNQLGYTWQGTPGSYNWVGGPIVPVDQWSHVALVVNGTSATVYLNGVAYTRTAAHSNATFNQAFQFGIDRGNIARNFKGQMDEVCIYNRALSQNEIRELMNLTRNNPNAQGLFGNDPSLIAYYQFNEGAGIPVQDKINSNHAFLAGVAVLTNASTAPVGGGVAQRITVNSAGIKDFTIPGVELTFPASGTYPNGELVVTRLNTPSAPVAAGQVLPDNPTSYWVVRNYGANSFSPLTKMRFYNVNKITSGMATTASNFSLYKRSSNADTDWGSSIDAADAVTVGVGNIGSVEFSTGLNMTSFSQFSIGYSLATAIPLVKLINFTATPENNKVILNWNSAIETDFCCYEVQRSADGVHFIPAGIVAGKIAPPYAYTFADANPVNGTNYYRLKIIYDNNAIEYLQVVSVNLLNTATGLMIYPNPSDDGWITIQFDKQLTAKKATLTVSNSAGQFVRSLYFDNLNNVKTYKIYLPGEGVYMLHITYEGGMQTTKKVIVD